MAYLEAATGQVNATDEYYDLRLKRHNTFGFIDVERLQGHKKNMMKLEKLYLHWTSKKLTIKVEYHTSRSPRPMGPRSSSISHLNTSIAKVCHPPK